MSLESQPEPVEPDPSILDTEFSLAMKEAIRAAGNREVNSLHMLYGVIASPDYAAARVLDSLGVDLAKLRGIIEQYQPSAPARAPASPSGIHSSRVLRRVMKEAYQHLASDAGQPGTEHILMVLLGEPDSEAAQLLAMVGLDRERLRRACPSVQDEQPPPIVRGELHDDSDEDWN